MVIEGRRRDRSGSSRNPAKHKIIRTAEEELEVKLGFDLFTEGDKRLGWLLTFAPDGSTFKSKYRFSPYFYAATKEKMQMDVEAYLRRRYEGQIAEIEIVDKEDLDLPVTGLNIAVEDRIRLLLCNNSLSVVAGDFFFGLNQRPQDFIDYIIDLREYDVPYHVRFAIDKDVRCGQWYDVSVSSSGINLEKRADLLQRAEVHVCAFDIETTKLPLKFPDAEYDLIMMISYIVDGQGYLIINREVYETPVSISNWENIEDLEYTPKPEFEGYFNVKNVKNEEELIKHWFAHMQELKPGIYVTYNGDFFDWPFLESRAAYHGIRMNDGFFVIKTKENVVQNSLAIWTVLHGSNEIAISLKAVKAVTKAKLGYDPIEVNPEDMVRLAMEQPQKMASYSVSDAVATYYLYMTYVHPFIFSLATIIPMAPDEVLRKGSGTLCEMLLMVQAVNTNIISIVVGTDNKGKTLIRKAYKANVICPNKHQAEQEKFYNNRLLESETYIGGHVECLESGVFRSDLTAKFQLDPSAYEQLIRNLDRDLQYAIRVEGKMHVDLVSNYEDVKNAIKEKVVLQPPSIVTDEVCTACDFNRPGKTCLRKLEWVWRGETFMAKKSDYYHLKKQIESERVEHVDGQLSKLFLDLPKAEQQSKLKERLKKYCQKAYKRVLDKPVTELREAGICMRENSFYVDTVRSFRDRRYEYKGLNKVWKGKLVEAKASGNSMKIQEAQDMVILYDSLQLAHKCILNSFYGYVMRKGARWYSMEMAGVVTYTGAKIIQNARLLIEKIGRPLELDTDGIWCALPGSFPENFTFKTKDPKKKLTISYPCVMLNVDVARNNTNDQYQTLKDPISKTYTTHNECSIEFEVDGPYKAMILPASKEEGILIKKRYAVFNHDGTLAELKGFEIKRRGELKLIKVFQAEVFDKFLCGTTLEECYSAVAAVANCWLDLLDNQGIDIADGELLDYISESSTMSKSLADYGEQKSCAVTTARRLADFLGDTMVKDKGLRCQYIVACEPQGTPVSERAIPVAIFETDAGIEISKFYLRKWCKMSSDVGIRTIVDWSYYRQRLSSAIQKIITIPAAMQKVVNPVPRVTHPDWLHKKIREKEDKFRQRKLIDIFSSSRKDNIFQKDASNNTAENMLDKLNATDLEDFANKENISTTRRQPIVRTYDKRKLTSAKVSCPTAGMPSMDQQQNLLGGSYENMVSPQKIDRNLDYQGWLAVNKRKWKYAREERKRRRLGDLRMSHQSAGATGFPSSVVNQKDQSRNGVNSFFRRQDLSLVRSHWQIIQVIPTKPGCFYAWVVAEGIMLKVPINIPRVFYLNTKEHLTEEFPGRCVNKILPHGRPTFNLIEVITDEEQFRAESRKLAAHLADPEVEVKYLNAQR
ncbi:DNA polymerase epsilon catalytic subunit A [Asimina triloba]